MGRCTERVYSMALVWCNTPTERVCSVRQLASTHLAMRCTHSNTGL